MVFIPEELVFAVIRGNRLRVKMNPEMPGDAKLLRVHHDPDRRAFAALYSHESFEECPVFCKPVIVDCDWSLHLEFNETRGIVDEAATHPFTSWHGKGFF